MAKVNKPENYKSVKQKLPKALQMSASFFKKNEKLPLWQKILFVICTAAICFSVAYYVGDDSLIPFIINIACILSGVTCE